MMSKFGLIRKTIMRMSTNSQGHTDEENVTFEKKNATVDSSNGIWSVKPKMKYHEKKSSILSRLSQRKAFDT
jgi:hypothetical protein